MELYTQRVNKVFFELPSETTAVEVVARLNGGEPVPLNVDTEPGLLRSAVLPYVKDEGRVTVEWTISPDGQSFYNYEPLTITDVYDIVTPILSDSQIREIHPVATPDEIVRVEKAVRHIVNAHTGQKFGKFVGSYQVKGSGSSALHLPSRILSLDGVDGLESEPWYEVTGGGYVLKFYPWGVPPVRGDYYGLHMHTGGVIHNPNNVKIGAWNSDKTYTIRGTWGWEEVPAQVQEAAKLLVNDYACADQAYRDRYLTSMTAADWRIQFNNGAFAQTGNVRADQLLSEFVLNRGWAVI